MDFTTLMEEVERLVGHKLPAECHGLIADYVREHLPQYAQAVTPLVIHNAYIESGEHVLPGSHFGYLIVCSVFDDRHWCAFRGLVDWTPARVAANGDEIDEATARRLFPIVPQALGDGEEYGNL